MTDVMQWIVVILRMEGSVAEGHETVYTVMNMTHNRKIESALKTE